MWNLHQGSHLLDKSLACSQEHSAPQEDLVLINNKANKGSVKTNTHSLKRARCRSYRIILAEKCQEGGTVIPFLPKADSQGGTPRAVFKSVDLFFQAINATRSYIGLFCCCDMVSIDVHWNCAQLHWSQEPCNLEVVQARLQGSKVSSACAAHLFHLPRSLACPAWARECCTGTRSKRFRKVATFTGKE